MRDYGYLRQVEGLEINQVEDGFIIYDPNRDSVHFLNHTAVFMLELCNGKHEADEMIRIIREAYGVENISRDDMVGILDRFMEEGLVFS